MRSLFALVSLSALVSCTHVGPLPARTDARLRAIENGLVPFTSPAELFRTDRPAEAKPATLAERMAHYHVPGLAVAVVEGSALAWAKPYGVLRADRVEPVSNDTLFQAASTSKAIAAAIVLHYVDEGVLRLDEDVNTYLRGWKVPENEFTRQQKVTLRLLLSHRAGLPGGNFGQVPGAGDPTLVQVLNGESPATNTPAVVGSVPGTAWSYSNIGYVVVQKVLEDVTGKPYEQIAQETVFRPLGMRHSTFVYPLAPAARAREAMPHDGEGVLREPIMPPTAVAQGGLVTTPSDLALFAGALMRAFEGRPNPVLSQAMARQMLHSEAELDPNMFGCPMGVGLGVMLHGAGESLAVVAPGSNVPGMNCWLVAFPTRGRGVVVMTNGAMGEVLAMEIITAVNTAYGTARAS